MMKKVLYTKFSRERSVPFQIATVISEEQGERSVTKQALNPKAAAHVERMTENYKKLEQCYRYPQLKICPCSRQEKGETVFPFLSGENLDYLITEHVKRGEFEQVKADVRLLYDILTSAKEIRPFEASEEFQKIFGNPELPEGQVAAPISNLDMLFANILVQMPGESRDGDAVNGKEENGEEPAYFLVDYEWVFDFMIPISYIFARSLILHGVLQTLPREQLEELYAIGKVNPEDVALYYDMEVKFQKYVSGEEEMNVLSKLYPRMKTCSFFLDYWNTEHVYYGVQVLGVPKDGTQPEQELHFSLHFQGEVKERLAIPDTERYQSFIFKPVDTECMMKMHYFNGFRGGEQQEIPLEHHNAQLQYENAYHFQQPPVFQIENQGYQELEFAYVVWHRNHYLVKECIDLRMENEQLHKELRKYTGRLHNRVIRKVGSLVKKK